MIISLTRALSEREFTYQYWTIFKLVDPQNVRSQRAMEKIGGVRVGTSLDGAGRDSFVYQIAVSALAHEGRV